MSISDLNHYVFRCTCATCDRLLDGCLKDILDGLYRLRVYACDLGSIPIMCDDYPFYNQIPM